MQEPEATGILRLWNSKSDTLVSRGIAGKYLGTFDFVVLLSRRCATLQMKLALKEQNVRLTHGFF